MRGGNRCAGRELVGLGGSGDQHVDTGRRHRQMRAAHRLREQAVVLVGRRHRDHVRIGGRIEWRRFRAHVARGRDQDDALGSGVAHRKLQHRVVGPGEAHIDDARAFVDRPFDAGDDLPRRGFRRLPAGGAEGVHRQDARAWRNAEELAMRCDRARHAGAVRMRRLGAAHGIVFLDDRAGEIGMAAVDLGVDHGHQHVAAGGGLVHLAEVELLDRVLLRRSARRPLRVRGGVLVDLVHIVRRGDADALGLQRAHHVGHPPSRRHTEGIERAAGDPAWLRADDRQAEPACGRVDGLPRHIGTGLKHHLG